MVLLVISGFASAETKNHGTATIKGVVEGANTPITVYLESVDDNPTRYYDGYKVTAENNGSFTFAEVNPGVYHLRAEANGFIVSSPSSDANASITLRANETRNGVRIAMVPATRVCGRVLENNVPKSTGVVAWRFDPEFGTLSRSSTSTTAADGTYQFPNLQPGTYFLQGYTTWYPGAASFSDAKPVVVGPVSKTPTECSYDIPLQYTGCRATKVQGSIARVQGMENQQFMVSFRQHSAAGGSVVAPISFNMDKTYKGGDSFEDTLCPGTYYVVLTDDTRMSWESEPSRHKVVFETQPITVGTDEVKGLILTPRPLVTIYGQVLFEGLSRRDICPARGGQYVAILREEDGQFQNIDLGEDGRFQFRNVAPGEYRLYVGAILREAVFLKSLVVNGNSFPGRQFTVSDVSPITMAVTLSGDIAHAEGHVSPDIRGEPRWDVASTRPRGSVSGRIADGQTNGLTVKLYAVRYNSDASYKYTTSPAQDGTFNFAEVDPGVYTLSVEGKNIVTSEYGAENGGELGTSIVVARGSHIKGLELHVLGLNSVCGKVTNETGTPQPQMRIFIESFKNGYMHGAGSQLDHFVTDENGQFRAVGIPPGDYFLGFPAVSSVRFFSKDGSLNSAIPVHLRSGHGVGCGAEGPIELHVPESVNSQHTIKGEVSADLSTKVGDRFWVSLMDINANGAEETVSSAKVDTETRFQIDRVPNGRFSLELRSGYGPEPMTWSGPYPPRTHLLAKQEIVVRDADISNVEIKSIELPTVTGKVRFTDLPDSWKGKSFDETTVWITLVPRTDQAPYSAKLSADGTFTVGPEDVGEYEVALQWNFNNQIFIRSVQLNGHLIEGRYLRLSSNEPVNLDIEISGNGGKVDFKVIPDDSLPTPEPHLTEVCRSLPNWAYQGVQVVLLPDPLFATGANGASSKERRIFYSMNVADGNRSWPQINNIPPGHYRALAGEHLSNGLLWQTAAALTEEEQKRWEALAALGQPVTVSAGSQQEIALPDRTVDIARLAAEFGLPIDSSLFAAQ
jgi:hypothetical protein